MNRKNKRSGFVHQIAAVVVMLSVIIGLLGFAFWQNVILPRINVDNNETPSKVQVGRVAYNTYRSDKHGLSFEYPRTWSVRANSDLGYYQSIEVIDETDATVAELVFGALGVGGVCPDDAEIDYTTMESEVAGVKALKTVYFNSMINARGGKYTVRFGLTDWNHEIGSVFQSCVFALSFDIDGSDFGYTAFADGYPDSKTKREFNSLAEAEQYLASDKYKEIKKMIMSLAN